ncbi:MAG: SPOR domain-containing protein [Dehalococcoidia bacterium]
MARMKGNHGGGGERAPGFDLGPITPPGRPVPPAGMARAGRRTAALPWGSLATIGLGAVVGLLIFAALWQFRGHGNNPPVEEDEGPPAVVAATSTPGADTLSTTASASASPTLESPPSAVPTTPAPTPEGTPAPIGPPTTRQRYVVQGGDACDLIRQALRFPASDFQAFQNAVVRLTGRADACNLGTGQVLCLPAKDDLTRLATLTRDDVCLAAP